MTITWRLYSCDDHLDLWNLPRDLWEGRLPARLRERGPRVVEQGGNAWWTCDGSVLGPFGMQMMKDYSDRTGRHRGRRRAGRDRAAAPRGHGSRRHPRLGDLRPEPVRAPDRG